MCELKKGYQLFMSQYVTEMMKYQQLVKIILTNWKMAEASTLFHFQNKQMELFN